MTLVNDETIAGETVGIEFFNPDRSPRGRVDLTRAVFNQAKGLLEARETVSCKATASTPRAPVCIMPLTRARDFSSALPPPGSKIPPRPP